MFSPFRLILFACILLRAACHASDGDERVDFFETKIRPVFAEHCFGCHSMAAKTKDALRGGLLLDQRDAAFQGGDNGVAIVPHKPQESLIFQALKHDGLEMPPDGKLSPQIVTDFEKWINEGAVWPQDLLHPTHNSVDLKKTDYAFWRNRHWAWKPFVKAEPERFENDAWSANFIDRFVLEKLQQNHLAPSPQANRRTLYRRLQFDLLGIPATFDKIQSFVANDDPDAYERTVDELLASPAYGERWGRHWLDVARYADNGGFNSQTPQLYTDFPYAYTYRDYVIRALNQDVPYDRFILEQLAADKLNLGEDNRALAALGFLSLGDKSFGTSKEDRIDDCIDTVTRGLIATTVSCARCHDHKYDPIPTADYYSLFGIFRASNIDIAARLHTVEKSARLPLLFASKNERRKYDNVLNAAKEKLDVAKQTHSQAAHAHCREHIAEYILATRELQREKRGKSKLPKQLVERWAKIVSSPDEELKQFFDAWNRLASVAVDSQNSSEFASQFQDLKQKAETNPTTMAIVSQFQQTPQNLSQVAEGYESLFASVGIRGNGEFNAPRIYSKAVVRQVQKLTQREDWPFNLKQDELLKLPIHSGHDELKTLQKKLQDVQFKHPRAVAFSDRESISNPNILIRGNPRQRGEEVPRRFLALFSKTPDNFTHGSGRLELAKAIVSSDNPITARVIVNRLWQHHFGRGLVENPGDFGTRTDAPLYRDLLDQLAIELVSSGWSLKRMHRLILTSMTYRQSSFDQSKAMEIDPENQLHWKMNRRRLEFEELRDSVLAAASRLNRTMHGPAESTWESQRRTIYGYVDRYRIAAAYETFDFPSSSRIAVQRNRTLVPQQALFLMNSPFVQDQVQAMVDNSAFRQLSSRRERIQHLYQIILQRVASAEELSTVDQFVAATDSNNIWRDLAHSLIMSNEFFYVD